MRAMANVFISSDVNTRWIAPEYFATPKIGALSFTSPGARGATPEADVYSYGLVSYQVGHSHDSMECFFS